MLTLVLDPQRQLEITLRLLGVAATVTKFLQGQSAQRSKVLKPGSCSAPLTGKKVDGQVFLKFFFH